MRKLILLSALFLLSLVGFSKNPESSPSYSVRKTIKDSNLINNETAFEFTVYAGGQLIKNQNIQLGYNKKQQNSVTDSKGNITLKLKSGKYKFQFFYSENYFEITTDSIQGKKGFKTYVNLFFEPSQYREVAEKPVIYLYSENNADVTIKFNNYNNLLFTYPEYKKEWKVKTNTNGDLLIGNKTFPYLFWEGNINLNSGAINTSEGFVVAKENLISFFENKLTKMGLNQKEQTDFITYWCPRMSQHESCYVRFLFNEEVEKHVGLNINPTPDNFFRVFMVWTDANKIDLSACFEEQEIKSTKRNGLTVIEWGGSEISQDLVDFTN